MARLFIVLLTVLSLSACDMVQSPAKPDPIPTSTVNYTAVGASDAIGYGGTVYCLPFTDCPNGTGYVQVLGRHFKSDGKTLTLLNLGVPGAVLSPEIQTLGNSLGRDIPGNFIDGEMIFVSATSTLVTIFAGGNDANTLGAAVDAGLGGSDPNSYIATAIQHFGRDMKTLVTTIRTKAPQARIVILNLPNMAALPYSSGDTLAQKRGLQQIAVGLSGQINTMTSQGAFVIDLMCDTTFYQPGSLSADGFHPNDAGYAYLASLIYPIANTGVATNPKASCSQMTVY